MKPPRPRQNVFSAAGKGTSVKEAQTGFARLRLCQSLIALAEKMKRTFALFAEGLLPGKFYYGHHVREAALAAKQAPGALAARKRIKQRRNGGVASNGRLRVLRAAGILRWLGCGLLFSPQGYDRRGGSLPGAQLT